MRLFLDSSALVKRYVLEKGSETVLQLCSESADIHLSALTFLESVSAFHLMKRTKRISPEVYHVMRSDLSADLQQAEIVPIHPSILESSVICIDRTGLRAPDAIQVMTARESGCELFLTGDEQQAKVAREYGLKVQLV